jgi:hypothetical protein
METSKRIVQYVVVHRTGTSIGRGYMHRVYVSIAGVDADGKYVHVPFGGGHSPYVVTRGYWAEHYKSGLSRADRAEYQAATAELAELAAKMTAEINRHK